VNKRQLAMTRGVFRRFPAKRVVNQRFWHANNGHVRPFEQLEWQEPEANKQLHTILSLAVIGMRPEPVQSVSDTGKIEKELLSDSRAATQAIAIVSCDTKEMCDAVRCASCTCVRWTDASDRLQPLIASASTATATATATASLACNDSSHNPRCNAFLCHVALKRTCSDHTMLLLHRLACWIV
jgi:hypothetical protein